VSDVRELYQGLVLEHGRHPQNFRTLEAADGTGEAHNPLCGDDVAVYVALAGGRIRDVAFQGRGCVVATASASIMTASIKGETTDEALALGERFGRHLTGEEPGAVSGELAAFSGVSRFPARIKCATLPWQALRAALGVTRR